MIVPRQKSAYLFGSTWFKNCKQKSRFTDYIQQFFTEIQSVQQDFELIFGYIFIFACTTSNQI